METISAHINVWILCASVCVWGGRDMNPFLLLLLLEFGIRFIFQLNCIYTCMRKRMRSSFICDFWWLCVRHSWRSEWEKESSIHFTLKSCVDKFKWDKRNKIRAKNGEKKKHKRNNNHTNCNWKRTDWSGCVFLYKWDLSIKMNISLFRKKRYTPNDMLKKKESSITLKCVFWKNEKKT